MITTFRRRTQAPFKFTLQVDILGVCAILEQKRRSRSVASTVLHRTFNLVTAEYARQEGNPLKGRPCSYFQIDRPLAKKLHKADPERTTCGPQYFMMRVRTAVEPTPAASPITAEDVKLEVRISPPKSAPRDFSCEGPIDLEVAVSI